MKKKIAGAALSNPRLLQPRGRIGEEALAREFACFVEVGCRLSVPANTVSAGERECGGKCLAKT